ncbi:putative kelch domain-containing protein [Erysiphe necator]|uniref:Putative kelch domain-containing protein n=1 Tax=Uncinula necator TaxID=52586 RepID=A0A0B1PGV1_UNCNE|nr:putative kelch domain-containing protein [Erysiphe necator]
MADKLIMQPPGSLETKLSASFDSDILQTERAYFLSGVRKGFKRLGGSISTRQRTLQPNPPTERSNSSLDAPLTAGADRQAATTKKGHARSTSDLGKPLPATPVSPSIEQLLRESSSSSQTSPSASASTSASTQVHTPVSTSNSTPASINSNTTPLNGSRTNTMDSSTSGISCTNTAPRSASTTNDSNRSDGDDDRKDDAISSKNNVSSSAPSPSQKSRSSGINSGLVTTPGTSSQHLSGLMCNVHRTTGREPPPLVGATTTILGDKLYVFGGRVLSRTRPVLTSDLYELDLVHRHWMRLAVTGDIPLPRYFHSFCALGDTKLVCFGGMSPAPSQGQVQSASISQNPDTQPEVVVMSDIYIFDTPTRKWTFIPTQEAPQGRYAHCTTILPSSANFSSGVPDICSPKSQSPTSLEAALNAVSQGGHLDGTGGAEMVVVGGQDSTNHYIEQISVFNFRSLRWTSTQILMKSCGAYRSVVAPLSSKVLSCLGKSSPLSPMSEVTNVGGGSSSDLKETGSSLLIYSNYNFLDVKLELQIRSPEGILTEKQMQGNFSPPGLRFPNGGVIGTNFVVSGTYLTSSKQEYALWALDLHTLTWSRIDAGGSVFSQGSWNRGVLWSRRNTFVILGNGKRSLVEDYNHRRINFTNVCMVELEAFGFYENPRKVSPMSGFISASCPLSSSTIKQALISGWTPGGRALSAAAEELGNLALEMKQLADMEIICVNGNRVPVNSRIIAKRWGPYFVRLLQEGTATTLDTSDVATLRPPDHMLQSGHRDSNITITQNPENLPNISQTSISTGISPSGLVEISAIVNPPDVTSLPPISRPRILFLPHTQLTVRALLHFLYTSALPPSTSSLCTPQILCSLLQIARPYQVDGLLEAVVERLHSILDSRNAAAVFNASAMAAGGCDTLSFIENYYTDNKTCNHPEDGDYSQNISATNQTTPLRLTINTSIGNIGQKLDDNEPISATESLDSDISSSERGGEKISKIWNGGVSSVIGLQKRGLRGLMEGRRLRERGSTSNAGQKDGQAKSRIGISS